MNLMPIIASNLNIELDEPFTVFSETFNKTEKLRLTLSGLEYFDIVSKKWYPTEAFLKDLLVGKSSIVSR